MKKRQYCDRCETETIHEIEITKNFADDHRDDTELSSTQMIARMNQEVERTVTCQQCGRSEIEI